MSIMRIPKKKKSFFTFITCFNDLALLRLSTSSFLFFWPLFLKRWCIPAIKDRESKSCLPHICSKNYASTKKYIYFIDTFWTGIMMKAVLWLLMNFRLMSEKKWISAICLCSNYFPSKKHTFTKYVLLWSMLNNLQIIHFLLAILCITWKNICDLHEKYVLHFVYIYSKFM